MNIKKKAFLYTILVMLCIIVGAVLLYVGGSYAISYIMSQSYIQMRDIAIICVIIAVVLLVGDYLYDKVLYVLENEDNGSEHR